MARALSEGHALPILEDALGYERSVPELRGRAYAERAALVQGAMKLENAKLVTGRSILVVDDVVTSGATLREAARVLKAAVPSPYMRLRSIALVDSAGI
jgi:predicted amidophosphoribosyltransferase